MNNCKHPDSEHTIAYWINDPRDIPAPYFFKTDNHIDALEWAETTILTPGPRPEWIKIYRSDNEFYTCFRWEK